MRVTIRTSIPQSSAQNLLLWTLTMNSKREIQSWITIYQKLRGKPRISH